MESETAPTIHKLFMQSPSSSPALSLTSRGSESPVSPACHQPTPPPKLNPATLYHHHSSLSTAYQFKREEMGQHLADSQINPITHHQAAYITSP